MSNSIQGRRFLVIGGAGVANGSAITRSLAAAGASVAIADLDLGRAEALAKDLADGGVTAVALPVDVRSGESVAASIAGAVERLGGAHHPLPRLGGPPLIPPRGPGPRATP